MKRFAVNMLTIIIVLAIGCLFLFSGTGCSDGKSHPGHGGIVQHVGAVATQQSEAHADAADKRLAEQLEGLDQGFDLPETYQDTRTEEQKELGEMLWNQIYADGHLDDSELELWIAYCDEVAPDRL